MRHLISLAMLFTAGAASAQTVEVGRGNWGDMPVVGMRQSAPVLYNELIDQIHAISRQRTCTTPGLNGSQVNLALPFLIQFNEAGAVDRIVLAETGCPQLNTIVGTMLVASSRAGVYRDTGENQTRWYRGEFTLRAS